MPFHVLKGSCKLPSRGTLLCQLSSLAISSTDGAGECSAAKPMGGNTELVPACAPVTVAVGFRLSQKYETHYFSQFGNTEKGTMSSR
jgi:hypothetical protein